MPPDLLEIFPPQAARSVRPRHQAAWARWRGAWRRARVLCWYPAEQAALLQWVDLTDDEAETVMVTYSPGALRPRHDQTPPLDDSAP